MRSKNYRLHHLERIIKKRLRIVKQWRITGGGEHPMEKEPHRLHKYNLNCGCKMCKYYKHAGNSKERISFKDLKKMQSHEKT